jgi:phosphoribosylformylglycinamidine synthase I
VTEPYSNRVAVIQFPGVNCEYETARAVRSVGLDAGIFRWNEDPALLEGSRAVIIPGGFSYQDRVRAGVVAAKDRIMDKLSELASAGRPVLGICNGAQVLVEAGFIPGIDWESVDLALAPNIMPDRDGYYCNWIYLKVEEGDCFWTGLYGKGEVLPVPVAHAEGRFVTEDNKIIERMKKNGQIVLRYCRSNGGYDHDFPTNPNGSVESAAGVCNVDGNVLALMPHPERCAWLRQVPEDIQGGWGKKRRKAIGNEPAMMTEGPGRGFFASLLEKGGGN